MLSGRLDEERRSIRRLFPITSSAALGTALLGTALLGAVLLGAVLLGAPFAAAARVTAARTAGAVNLGEFEGVEITHGRSPVCCLGPAALA